jgi:hypothetical protein
MPRYYFHIQSAGHRYDDKEGSEFQNNEAALGEAMIAARELSADRLKRGLATEGELFEVEDANGSVVGTVPFPRTSG